MNKLIMIASLVMFGLLEGSDVQGFVIPDLVMAIGILWASAMLLYVVKHGGE